MGENNPYGFRLEDDMQPAPQAGQTTISQGYRLNGVEYAGAQMQNAGNGMQANLYNGTTSVTSRKKTALVISLAVMCGGLFLSTVAALVGLVVMAFVPSLIVPMIVGSVILEFAMVFVTDKMIQKENMVAAVICYCLFALANGTTFMSIFLTYAPQSVLGIFLVTTLIFGGTALVALIVKKDLSGLQTSMIMGLFALIALSVIYLIFQWPMLDLFICIFGILLFIGITAFDIKRITGEAEQDLQRPIWGIGLAGGMNLYLDFVNLLLKILRLFGRRK